MLFYVLNIKVYTTSSQNIKPGKMVSLTNQYGFFYQRKTYVQYHLMSVLLSYKKQKTFSSFIVILP